MAKTVMIVEDNELNMKLFRDLLEAYGYRTIGTSKGFEVLDLARKRRPTRAPISRPQKKFPTRRRDGCDKGAIKTGA
jgi:CheY-like chemotaxis protein